MKPIGCLSDDCRGSGTKNGLEDEDTCGTRLAVILNILALTQAAEQQQ